MLLTRREALSLAATIRGTGELPRVPFGPHKISRLIVGGNPVSGNSHLNAEADREMLDYFTAANIKQLLRSCEGAGINTWQSRGDRHILRLLREYRQEGGRIEWIAQTATEIRFDRNLPEMVAARPLGIYHHGSNTDRAWQAGKMEEVRDALKAIRQSGVRVGLGTHIPEVIDYVESKGWDVDFHMTCLFNLSRTEEEKQRLAGEKIRGELFWDPDRIEMLKRVRQASKQCLIFKVYGASRHCDSREKMLNALKLAFQYAKPADAIVIGMFPKLTDQVTQNRELFLEAEKGDRRIFPAA